MRSSRTYSIAGRFAVATLLWASLTVPAALEATAQDSTPMATPQEATAMTGAQDATPMAAQQATPMATPMATLDVPLIDATGDAVGLATFSEDANGVTVQLLIEGLSPGEHGWHLHDVGLCERGGAEPFASAGGHWNPTGEPHGAPDDAEHHVGDFGNLIATENGLAEAEITSSEFTLGDGPTSVYDEDGTAIIVHEGRDDLVTQPSGNSGPRYACGVVAERTMDTMDTAATPESAATTPVDTGATPMAMATPQGTEATPMTAATPVGSPVTPMAVATLEATGATPMGIATPEDTNATPTP